MGKTTPARSRVITRTRAIVIMGLLALGAIAITGSLGAQTFENYPDLVSDPPEDLTAPEVKTWNGVDYLVVRFDGFVTNIGDGPVHIEGNPQADATPGTEVAQHILDPSGNSTARFPYDVTAASPAIQFENSDGHNHWHLMRIMEYSLWNEDKTVQVTPGEKIGFCLWDIQRISGSAPGVYNGGGNWCAGTGYAGGGPDATYLEMGITEGWRDVYSSGISLQWVDVSDVAPGNYFLSALTDPHDIVEESDETNNGRVWTNEMTVVPGYLAGDVAAGQVAESAIVTLTSQSFGTPGTLAYRIESAPANGTIDVAVGDIVTGGTVLYTPNPGYAGPDSFTYSAFDTGSAYPANPDPADVNATVTMDVVAVNTAPTVDAVADQTSTVGDSVALQISAADVDNDTLTYSAAELPNGLSIDSATGLISGIVADATSPWGTIVAVSDGTDETTVSFIWTVLAAPNNAPTVDAIADQSSTVGDAVSVQVVASDVDGDTLAYSAAGLPSGVTIDGSSGLISGAVAGPASSTTVTVTVDDGVDQTSVSFAWTVADAPNTPPTINAVADQTSTVGDAVSVAIVAGDADGDPLAYTATGLPAGLSIDGTTGLISGTLADGSDGTYTVTVEASDGVDAAATSFAWTVEVVDTVLGCTATLNGSAMTVSIDTVSGATGYNVFRKSNNFNPYMYFGWTSGDTFTVDPMPYGVRQKIAVKATYANGTTSKSTNCGFITYEAPASAALACDVTMDGATATIIIDTIPDAVGYSVWRAKKHGHARLDLGYVTGDVLVVDLPPGNNQLIRIRAHFADGSQTAHVNCGKVNA